MAEKRVIEYEAASELANDDWLLIDGVTEGTRKARSSTVTAELGAQVTNLASTVGGLTQVAMGHEQSFAPDYNESASYDVGDLVMQYHGLYRCTAATTGTWDAGKWARTEVAEQLEESGKIDDVQVNGVSVVTDKVASIDLTDMQDDIDSKQADTKIGGASILDNNKVANLDFLASYGEASGSIASFNDGAAMPLKSLKVSIEAVQAGNGDPSPTNIRPFTGWSAVNVTRSGINLWDEQWEVGSYSASTGEKTDANNRIRCKNPIKVIGGSTIYISSANSNMRIYLYYPNGEYKTTPSALMDTEYTIPDDVGWMTFNMATTYGTTYNNDVSINYPSTNTSYTAYNGQTYTTQLKDGQGNPMTCYGGQLVNVNGVQSLTNILGQQNMTNWNWVRESAGGGNYRFRSKSTVSSYYERQSTQGLSSAFKINRSPIGGVKIDNTLWVHSDGLVYIYCDTYTDVDTFKEFIKDVQLFLPRINPTQITQDSLPISSQSGVNNVWCDTGNIMECKYVRDNSAVINDLIARVTALENA